MFRYYLIDPRFKNDSTIRTRAATIGGIPDIQVEKMTMIEYILKAAPAAGKDRFVYHHTIPAYPRLLCPSIRPTDLLVSWLDSRYPHYCSHIIHLRAAILTRTSSPTSLT